MIISLDEILELVDLGNLKTRKEEMQKTIDALSLQRGGKYLSIGVGMNSLPLIVALHGLNVTGIDISEESLQYQRELSEKFATQLKEAGGGLKLANIDIENGSLRGLDGRFDCIECVNFRSKEDPLTSFAQILLYFGKPESCYLIATWGGLSGVDDSTLQALISTVKDSKRRFQIVETGLFTSDKYTHPPHGVVLKVY